MKPLRVDEPQPGCYKMKLTRGGPFVGVKIEDLTPYEECEGCAGKGTKEAALSGVESICEECGGKGLVLVGDEAYRAWRDGREVPVDVVWPFCALHPIHEQEYLYLIDRAAYARAFDPEAPEAHPRDKADILKAPVPKPKGNT